MMQHVNRMSKTLADWLVHGKKYNIKNIRKLCPKYMVFREIITEKKLQKLHTLAISAKQARKRQTIQNTANISSTSCFWQRLLPHTYSINKIMNDLRAKAASVMMCLFFEKIKKQDAVFEVGIMISLTSISKTQYSSTELT